MKISFYTLGCKVNQYETQSMREQFRDAGYTIAADDESADICVINTCSVTNVADRKSRQYIRRMKHLNPDAVIVVTGCYAQTDPDAVSAIEDVDLVAGTNEKSNILNYVSDYLKRQSAMPGRRSETEIHVRKYEELDTYEDMGMITAMESRSRAFVKIEEGCDRFCSYCIIPYARGRVRSRGIRSVTEEITELVRSGYHEAVLTGINTALYGSDFPDGGHSAGLFRLLDEISALEGEFRIRLSSLEPNVIDDQVAVKLVTYEKLCRHMHLSIQSGSDAVLKRMRRRYNTEQYMKIVRTLRSIDPDYGITTDIIVGFPGETEEEFEETLETVRKIQFSRIHVFRYSRRNHTVAADMPGQVDGAIKNRRAKLLEEESEKQTLAFYRQNSGSIRTVLFERANADGSYLSGYTDNYIPVYIPAAETGQKDLHSFREVMLTTPFLDGMTGEIRR